jgi:hypothetical protein
MENEMIADEVINNSEDVRPSEVLPQSDSLNDDVSKINSKLSDDLEGDLEDDIDDDIVLELKRETYKSKDKSGKKRIFWTYFVSGEAYGKAVRADFEAFDKGGYEVLDIIYDIGSKVNLVMREEKMTDSKTGQISSYNTFTAFTVDPSGTVVDYKVKPMRPSDKAIFMMLYNAAKANKIN